jgi:hypothetical protein
MAFTPWSLLMPDLARAVDLDRKPINYSTADPPNVIERLQARLCLSVKERFLHDRFSEVEGGLFSKTPFQRFGYQSSTNLRDAHT